MSISEKSAILQTEYNNFKEEFQKKCQEMFKQITKDFFEHNTDCKAIKWTQYTPYFNDGDECVFGLGDITYTNAEGDDLVDVTHYGEYVGEKEEIWAESSYGYVQGKEFENFLHSDFMLEILESMFGDHVIVTATKNGFDLEEYNHD